VIYQKALDLQRMNQSKVPPEKGVPVTTLLHEAIPFGWSVSNPEIKRAGQLMKNLYYTQIPTQGFGELAC
jgi:hypothetical protein